VSHVVRISMSSDLDLVPDGVERPRDVPPAIFDHALATFAGCKRVDMKTMAADLGIHRATLYRKVRSRDHLLGAVLWYGTRRLLARALRETGHLSGRERVLAVFDVFNRLVAAQAPLRRLLDAEPEAALRILTSKHGPIQSGLVEAQARLLVREVILDDLTGGFTPSTLAYVLVRLGESFLYADVIGHGAPDLDAALSIVTRLLDASVIDPAPERTPSPAPARP